TPPCTSVVRTRDGGRTWAGIPAPPAEMTASGPTGVGEIRFADATDGWAIGPELWATHDGGAHWSHTTLPGIDLPATVTDLAAADAMVHVTVIDDKGVHILSSPVGKEDWKLSPTTVPIGAGPVPRSQLVLQGAGGWLIEVDRTVVGGARLSAGSWVPWQPPCADAGGSALLAAPSSEEVVVVCNEGQWNDHPQAVRYYRSSDGGTTFRETATPVTTPCCVSAVASGAAGTAVVASTDGAAVLIATFDDGATWADVYRGADRSSLIEVGFTSRSQGVAIEVPTEARTGALLMTADGGHTWKAVPFR
ncbi:MAG: hypothetical protein M3Y04_07475, partial [Actinomycetota bacterium]|nr:hypothetical protein [Actinomycetota bacterium]